MDGATELGLQVAATLRRGDLVSDELIAAALAPVLSSAAKAGEGYILDGFPRTLEQFALLERLGEQEDVAPQCVVFLDVGEDVLRHRLLTRAGEQGRSDDTPEVIARRLEVFRAETQPVIDLYQDRRVLITVNGGRTLDEITGEILALLDRRATH